MSVSEDALSLLRLLHEMEAGDDDTEAVGNAVDLGRKTGRDTDEVQKILDPYLDLYVTADSHFLEAGKGSPLRYRYRLTQEGRRLFD